MSALALTPSSAMACGVAQTVKAAAKKAQAKSEGHVYCRPRAQVGQMLFQKALNGLEGWQAGVIANKVLKAVDKNRHNPVIQGLYKRFSKASSLWKWRGQDEWAERWVELDPAEGVLSYWIPVEKDLRVSTTSRKGMVSITSVTSILSSFGGSSGPRKRQFSLNSVLWTQTSRSHLAFQIAFVEEEDCRKVNRLLHFKAKTEDDFDMWVDALSSYGLGRGTDTATPKVTDVATSARTAGARFSCA